MLKVVPNRYEFLSSAEHKTFWRMLVTKQLLVHIDFHSMEEKNAMEVHGDQRLFVWNEGE